MADKMFQIPIVLTIPATSYEEAMREGARVADELSTDAGMGVELVTYQFQSKDMS